MAWQKYTLLFRLLSPLHIGYRKVSNLQQTRGYVPGKNLWAALTARLTRDYDNGHSGQRYVEIGQAVNQHFRFGYLYPALPKEMKQEVKSANEVTIYYPWEEEALFGYRFLSSYASTALNHDYQAAAEGSLHEVEFIRPHTRPLKESETAMPVYLVGDLYVSEKVQHDPVLQNWKTALGHIQLGGERGYGWGRVRLAAYDLQTTSDELLTVTLREKEPIAAHALATGDKAVSKVSGPVEPLVGWERDNTARKQNWRVSQATICYTPGAITTDKVTFIIGDYGLLRA